MVNSPEFYMELALEKAWAYQGLTYPNPPVGAVITGIKDRFIAYGVHKKAGAPHAEVNAIKNAYFELTNDKEILQLEKSDEIHSYLRANHNGIFRDKNIFVTLEPCNHYGKTPPCSELIASLRFNKVFIGTQEKNKKASGGAEFLKKKGLRVEILNKPRCKELLEPFALWQKDRFVFFKLAMSGNGVIDGGVISSKSSREIVHKLRDKCDLLVIGGNTVRVDRPTLDARLCDGKAPDVLIYSKTKEFDKSIALFGVPNRTVHVEESLEKINDYNFVMIEGGEGMLRATKEFVEHYLFFRSPSFKEGFAPMVELKLRELFSLAIAEDRYSWLKKV